MKKLASLISKIENYCWTREMSSSLSADIEENLNYPDWEPLEHQSRKNYKTNDKDVLETNRDQPNNRYHQNKER